MRTLLRKSHYFFFTKMNQSDLRKTLSSLKMWSRDGSGLDLSIRSCFSIMPGILTGLTRFLLNVGKVNNATQHLP